MSLRLSLQLPPSWACSLSASMRACLLALGLSLIVGAPAVAETSARVVSAAAARDLLAQGAAVWDVRTSQAYQASRIPGAIQADPALLGQWARAGDLRALGQAVSQAGIDLSRTVVLYGEAGDPGAQALHSALQRVASGRVWWLVGGLREWQLSGATVEHGPVGQARAPVPQRLVSFQPDLDPAADGQDLAAGWARRSRTIAATSSHWLYAAGN